MDRERVETQIALNHDSIVADWKARAERNDEANYSFLRSLKHREYGFEPDEAAAELHQQVFTIVDCTRCTNCCQTMDVVLDGTDSRVANRHLVPPGDAEPPPPSSRRRNAAACVLSHRS